MSGALKMQERKKQDWKMTDKITGRFNSGMDE